MADRTLPVQSGHAHAALVTDAVAAAAAHRARVPELSQWSLTAGTRPLAVLPGETLGTLPPDVLQLRLQPPVMLVGRDHGDAATTVLHLQTYFQRICIKVLSV